MARDVDYGTDEAGWSISSLVTVCLLLLVRCRFRPGSRSLIASDGTNSHLIKCRGHRSLLKALRSNSRTFTPSRAKTNIARAGDLRCGSLNVDTVDTLDVVD